MTYVEFEPTVSASKRSKPSPQTARPLAPADNNIYIRIKQLNAHIVGFKVLTTVSMKMTAFGILRGVV
jgi:hypothetical protein